MDLNGPLFRVQVLYVQNELDVLYVCACIYLRDGKKVEGVSNRVGRSRPWRYYEAEGGVMLELSLLGTSCLMLRRYFCF